MPGRFEEENARAPVSFANRFLRRIGVIHHPANPNFSLQHAKVGIPESIAQGHFNRSAGGEAVEQPGSLFLAVCFDGDIEIVAHRLGVYTAI